MMRIAVYLFLGALLLKSFNAAAQSWLWAKGSIGSNTDYSNNVATDPSGNVLVTGGFQSATITFGAVTLTNSGGVDMYLVKYDPAGNVLWAKSAGGTMYDNARSVCSDAGGNIYVTGGFISSSISFGATTLVNTASTSVFVVKYDPLGNVLWARSAFGLSGSDDDHGYGVCADPTGNVLVTGSFEGPSVTFSPFTLTSNTTFINGSNIFLVKYDPSGNVIWAKSAGGTYSDASRDVSIDPAGNIFITGSFTSSTVTFGSTTLTNTNFLAMTADIFIAKYDPAGNVLWAKGAGGLSYDEGMALSADPSGNVFVTGTFISTSITFGSATFTNAGPSSSSELFIAKYDPSGNVLWAKGAGGTSYEYGTGVSTDAAGNVYFVGSFRSSSIIFNSTTLTGGSAPDNLYIVKFDPAGNVLCASSLNNGDSGNGQVASDNFGNAFVAEGFSANPFVVGSTSLPLTGQFDIFTAKWTCSSVLSVTASSNSVSCNGQCTGTATVTPTGTSPYSYMWSNSQTTSAISGLCAGTYSVLVTDGTSATAIATVTVTDPNALTAAIATPILNCSGSPLSAMATGGGGTPFYSYSWSNGQTTQSASGLTSGTYTATITDANGCTKTETVTITQSPAITVSVTTNTASCLSSNGSATANPSGGTPGFTYAWNNSQTTQTATGLAAGIYTVTITDAAGCTQTAQANISNTGSPQGNISPVTNILCNGGNNGNAIVNITVGTAPYTYSWNPSGQTTSAATNLSAGNYVVTVTDALGCIVIVDTVITEPVAITTSVTSTSTNCAGATGSATANASGGTASYSYLWSNNQTTQTATGLSAGNYTATITDANGCTKTQTVAITSANNTLSVTTTSTQAGCTVNNGTATANASSGTPGYTYSWDNGQLTQTATGLAQGNYTATVTDANGCTQTQTVSVTQTPGPAANATSSPSQIISGESTTLTATGGGMYQWSPSADLSCTTCSNPTATPSQTTSYCVLVTDSNGCTDSACIIITVDIPCGTIFIPNAFSPNSDSENDLECVIGGCIKSMHIAIYNRWGEKVFESADQTICWDGIHKGKLLNTAVFGYYLEATLTNGEKISRKGNISLIR